jgi:dTDP-L-rhamnose 4-epimerase
MPRESERRRVRAVNHGEQYQMTKRVLITGGAGFIGSHLADELLGRGYDVRVLDSLTPQVHGPDARRPAYLHRDVELIVGDVRDPGSVRRALVDVDAVFHFAAVVGVGQSMYELARYTATNNGGTAALLEALIKQPVERLIVASSMSVYGEGLYRTREGALVAGVERRVAQLKQKRWEVCDSSGEPMAPVATPESKTPALASLYALSKFDQERMCLMIGRAYAIPTVALRFFNTYGPRQALGNPYTGVLAIFAARLLNGNAPMIFEDGQQQRDFVNVHDVARACRLALETTLVTDCVLNVGSGQPHSVAGVAERMQEVLAKSSVLPEVTGNYRVGDIRHCYADISAAERLLGYRPYVGLDEGLTELAAWLEQESAVDRVSEARAELTARGLTL